MNQQKADTFECPHCGHRKSACTDSRYHEEYKMIRRRKKCCGCGKTFHTWEQIGYVTKPNGSAGYDFRLLDRINKLPTNIRAAITTIIKDIEDFS